ncbi:DUF317 domain-containing protein [Streptomyces sp. NPDC058603]|uniref:DUF317 domain-containing protein n=1 Tax=Streptomyces sp. NPDC058603 TaxID=3346551 RepID=UPI003660967A
MPAEILAGFTNALIVPKPAIQARPLAPLAAGGWTVDDLGSHWALSPDHAVSLTHATADDSTRPWFAQTSVPHGNGFDEVWAARFSEHTPHYLITAFTMALADTAPLVRHRTRTPPMARSTLVTRPSDATADSIREQLVSRERAARPIGRTRLPRPPAVPDPKPGRQR